MGFSPSVLYLEHTIRFAAGPNVRPGNVDVTGQGTTSADPYQPPNNYRWICARIKTDAATVGALGPMSGIIDISNGIEEPQQDWPAVGAESIAAPVAVSAANPNPPATVTIVPSQVDTFVSGAVSVVLVYRRFP